jgi:DNA-3-methyladenine glycosylase II
MIKISPECLEHLRKDKILRKLIDSIEVPKRGKKVNVYESLINSIISQQLSVKAASTIHSRFINYFGGKAPSPAEIINMDIEVMRELGLSYQKASYMHNLGLYFSNVSIDNKYWNKKSDSEIISELIQIKGIGIWTVQMMLMFNLFREDVFPIDDLIIKNSIIRLYKVKGETKKEINNKVIHIADKWSPYKSVACLYLWGSKDINL